jgi:hypothetical protein
LAEVACVQDAVFEVGDVLAVLVKSRLLFSLARGGLGVKTDQAENRCRSRRRPRSGRRRVSGAIRTLATSINI